jgi:hypothetical protein
MHMTSTYATTPDLTDRLSAAYAVPANSDQLLTKASELIDFATQGRAEWVFTHAAYADGTSTAVAVAALLLATCDQVEFWLETGEEHDVLGLDGSLMGGRLQVQRMPGYIGPRPKRGLMQVGLYWAGASAV